MWHKTVYNVRSNESFNQASNAMDFQPANAIEIRITTYVTTKTSNEGSYSVCDITVQTFALNVSIVETVQTFSNFVLQITFDENTA